MNRLLYLAGVLALMLYVLAGCGAKENGPVTALDQLGEPGRKIGAPSDLAELETLKKDYPEAEVIAYDDYPLAYEAVRTGKLDAFVYARREMEFAIANGTGGVRVLDETYSKNTVAIGISPVSQIPNLQKKINAFLAELRADGTLDDMYERWVIRGDDTMPEIPKPEHPALRLCVGTTGIVMPFSYYVGTELSGYDIELANRLAAWLDAELEYKIYDYGGIVPAAQSGDVDCIMANLFVTKERADSLPFSDPLFELEITAMVRDPGGMAAGAAAGGPELSEFSDLSGKKVSMLTGAPFEELVRSHAPDVSEFSYFTAMPDMVLALKSGKTDAVLINNAIATLTVNRDAGIALFPHNLQEAQFGFAFAKGEAERDRWQAAYDAIPQETKQALWDKWTGSDEGAKVLPEQDWPGRNGTVRVAACDALEPMSYAGEGGEIKGFDIEMLLLMARELDVHVEFVGMEFSALLAYVQSGKALLGAGSIIVTEERSQAVDFVGYWPAAFVLMVRSTQTQTETVKTLADMETATIGVLSGTNFPQIINEHLPEAKVLYYNSTSDEVVALKTGKVDALALDEPVARNMQAEDDSLVSIPELLDSQEYAFVLGKSERGEALCAELSEYLRGLWDDGTIETLQNKWLDRGDLSSVEMLDYRELPDVNGTVRLAAFQYPPFILLNGELFCGYEIELIAMFCRDRGYVLEISEMSNDAILASVQTGKADIGCCGISITEERKESILFSEPDYIGGTALLVLKKDAAGQEGGGFFASVAESFEKTFIRENRWQLFVQGIGTTLLITVLSIIFGTVLGFGVFMLCRNGNPIANAITRFCVWLVQGMPVVVLLMILYYIIFGKVAISGTTVSVIGFTLVFGAAVYSMVKSGVATVDRGQTEAAYALGYTDRKTFYRVVLPQALPHFMPAYKGEITAIIKATAIVGYVAVQDLTKMGDIVRSRTYDAFFPLIAVAVIYFILAAILTFIVSKIELRIDPKRRSREDILKGLDIHDRAEAKI